VNTVSVASFRGVPNPRVNGRSIDFAMGKVLGGRSGINLMVWARGYKRDWEFFAAEAGDPAWGYDSVLDIYRRIEDWHVTPEPARRGTGGPVYVESAPESNPPAPATVQAARSVGIPTFDSPNGQMMEVRGGAAIADIRSRDGERQTVFVTRVTFDGDRATGVELDYHGETRWIGADRDVVLSLGAIDTPKVLMYSGIGDEAEPDRFRNPVRQHLAGVGRNFQDHNPIFHVWQYRAPLPPRNNMAEMTAYWNALSEPDAPEVFVCQVEVPIAPADAVARCGLPQAG
jgi:choline dehydrogenase